MFQAEAMLELVNAQALDAALGALHDWRNTNRAHVTIEVDVNDLSGAQASLGEAVPADGSQIPDMIIVIFAEREADVVDAVASLSTALKGIAGSKTRILGQQRHEILSADGAVRLFYALSRLPGMSRRDFQDYWLNTHAEFGRRFIPPYSYIQAHTDGDFTAMLCGCSGWAASAFDGVVAVHFPDLEAAQRQLSQDYVTTIALEDERRFIDHSRVQMGFYSVKAFD